MALPIGDANPTSRTAFVLWLVTAANLGVLLFLQLPLDACGQQVFAYRFGVIPAEVTSLTPLDQAQLEALLGPCAAEVTDKNIWLSILTAMFLHGGIGHLVSNLLFLVVFGNNVEDRLGHARFLLFYLVGGVAATLAYTALRPGSIVPLVGASGAVAAVLGAYLILHPRTTVFALVPFPAYLLAVIIPGIRIVRWLLIIAVVSLPAWLMLGGWFVLQFLSARAPAGDGVAYEAHVGGFLAGIVLLLVLDRWRRAHGRQPFHQPRRRAQ